MTTTLFGRQLLGPRAAPRRFLRDPRFAGAIAATVVGAVDSFAHTRAELDDKVGRLDRAINDLEREDVHANIVYATPSALRNEAKKWAYLPALAKKFNDEADRMEARENGFTSDAVGGGSSGSVSVHPPDPEMVGIESKNTGRSAAQIKKELIFSRAWNDFYRRWKGVDWDQSFFLHGIPPGWDTVNGFETEYDQLRVKYAALGYAVNAEPRITDKDILEDKSRPKPKDPFGDIFTILKWGLGGLFVVGGVVIWRMAA